MQPMKRVGRGTTINNSPANIDPTYFLQNC